MTMYQRANRDGINEFLLGFDIDINRVSNENLDATGYDYLSVDSVGRPIRDPQAKTHTIVRVRKEWPNTEVWPVLEQLLDGVALEDTKAKSEKPKVEPRPVAPESEKPKVEPRPVAPKKTEAK